MYVVKKEREDRTRVKSPLLLLKAFGSAVSPLSALLLYLRILGLSKHYDMFFFALLV